MASPNRKANASPLGRDLGLTLRTSRRWLDLPMAGFQRHEVPALSGDPVKRVSRKPKGHFADTGFACWAQALSSPGALGGHPQWGALFETFVVGEARRQASLLSPPPRLHHGRSAGGAEVDLLLERDGRHHPIEGEARSRGSAADARGIRAFREAHPGLDVAPGLVIAPCERFERLTPRDAALPWDLGVACTSV